MRVSKVASSRAQLNYTKLRYRTATRLNYSVTLNNPDVINITTSYVWWRACLSINEQAVNVD